MTNRFILCCAVIPFSLFSMDQPSAVVDQRLFLTFTCQHIIAWTYYDVICMSLVHSGWRIALQDTADLRKDWFKKEFIKEKRKAKNAKTITFNKGTWHPLGCAFSTWVFTRKENTQRHSWVQTFCLYGAWVTEISSENNQDELKNIYEMMWDFAINKSYSLTAIKNGFTLIENEPIKNENNLKTFSDPIFINGKFESTTLVTIDLLQLPPEKLTLYYCHKACKKNVCPRIID